MSCYKGSADLTDLVFSPPLCVGWHRALHCVVQGYLNRATAGVKGLGTSAGSSM